MASSHNGKGRFNLDGVSLVTTVLVPPNGMPGAQRPPVTSLPTGTSSPVVLCGLWPAQQSLADRRIHWRSARGTVPDFKLRTIKGWKIVKKLHLDILTTDAPFDSSSDDVVIVAENKNNPISLMKAESQSI